ncbi:hypothetical protein BDZ89DRAFT_1163701 [Hymenopellis radicata]|nr:hypothetical protein BDZ89DRAFT_1163701 [Hymenopellis radicata]
MSTIVSTYYSAGSPLTRCRISVQVSRSPWETVTGLKECSSSCAIPIIYHEDADDDEHNGLSARSAATAIYGLDGHDDKTPIHSVPLISKSPFISPNPSQYTVSDSAVECTATSCCSFPDSERLRSRLEESEDDLEPSSDSEEEIFRCHPSMESEHTIAFNVEEDDEVLGYAFSTRLVVVDSLHPDRAPHIVITPAMTTPYDEYVAWSNRPQPQWSGCLSVPPTWVYSGSIPNYVVNFNPPSSQARGKRVFNRTHFAGQIEKASVERLVMYHVVTAIHRRAMKAIAYAVASIARLRSHTSPSFVDPQPEFKWIDPAIPLLAEYYRTPNTIVLESNDAFTAPHIVISEAPTANPWIAWMNIPPEQHVGSLAVPGQQVYRDSWDEEQPSIDGSDYSEDWDPECSFSSDEDWEVDTPRPGSPMSLSEEIEMADHLERFLDAMEEDELEHKLEASPWDDEEDDLPEFDEWYLDIAQRSGL